MIDALLRPLAALSLTLLERLSTPMPRRRGMALLVVLTTVAVLSISIVEFVYNTRVNLFLAQNQRDEVKAYFVARSAVNLQLLTLNYQYELEQQGGFIGQAIERSNFQLWEYLDILLPTFFSGRIDSPIGSIDLEQTGATGFGGLQGSPEIKPPQPEEGKINLNEFAGRDIPQDQLRRFCSMLALPAYDDVFGGGMRQRAVQRDRFEVIAAIIDHLDSDSDMTVLDENCVLSQGGTGNESIRYRDLDWGPKNEALVTVDELYTVPGVTDSFMQQFRENLTVYPVPGQFYIALADAEAFAGFLCQHLIITREDFNGCSLPNVGTKVALLALAMDGYVSFFRDKFGLIGFYLGGMMGESQDRVADGLMRGQMNAFSRERQFISVLQSLQADPQLMMFFISYADPRTAQLFGYQAMMGVMPTFEDIVFDEAAMLQKISIEAPRVFTLEATGRYGAASRTIRTVVDFRENARLLYWREF